ncbi:MAG: DUF6783 domain-containing protein [Blautia sp.]
MRTKSPTNCDAHLAESLFQTRSKLKKEQIFQIRKICSFNRIKGVPCFNYEYPPDGL